MGGIFEFKVWVDLEYMKIMMCSKINEIFLYFKCFFYYIFEDERFYVGLVFLIINFVRLVNKGVIIVYVCVIVCLCMYDIF